MMTVNTSADSPQGFIPEICTTPLALDLLGISLAECSPSRDIARSDSHCVSFDGHSSQTRNHTLHCDLRHHPIHAAVRRSDGSSAPHRLQLIFDDHHHAGTRERESHTPQSNCRTDSKLDAGQVDTKYVYEY